MQIKATEKKSSRLQNKDDMIQDVIKNFAKLDVNEELKEPCQKLNNRQDSNRSGNSTTSSDDERS